MRGRNTMPVLVACVWHTVSLRPSLEWFIFDPPDPPFVRPLPTDLMQRASAKSPVRPTSWRQCANAAHGRRTGGATRHTDGRASRSTIAASRTGRARPRGAARGRRAGTPSSDGAPRAAHGTRCSCREAARRRDERSRHSPNSLPTPFVTGVLATPLGASRENVAARPASRTCVCACCSHADQGRHVRGRCRRAHSGGAFLSAAMHVDPSEGVRLPRCGWRVRGLGANSQTLCRSLSGARPNLAVATPARLRWGTGGPRSPWSSRGSPGWRQRESEHRARGAAAEWRVLQRPSAGGSLSPRHVLRAGGPRWGALMPGDDPSPHEASDTRGGPGPHVVASRPCDTNGCVQA